MSLVPHTCTWRGNDDCLACKLKQEHCAKCSVLFTWDGKDTSYLCDFCRPARVREKP